MPRKQYTIDPAAFTYKEWAEVYYGSTLYPITVALGRYKPPLFKRSKRAIEAAVLSLESKAEGILNGALGPELEPGENADWALDLRNAAKVLKGILASPSTKTKGKTK